VLAEVEGERYRQFTVEIPTGQWDDVLKGADDGPLILLVSSTLIFSTNLKELLRCKHGDGRTGSWTKYQRHHGWVKVIWKLSEDRDSTWTSENSFNLSDDDLPQKLISHMLTIHRSLRDEGGGNGVGLEEWGHIAEDLLQGS
jgi:hypothetical protein